MSKPTGRLEQARWAVNISRHERDEARKAFQAAMWRHEAAVTRNSEAIDRFMAILVETIEAGDTAGLRQMARAVRGYERDRARIDAASQPISLG